jgi:hypothetical protein
MTPRKKVDLRTLPTWLQYLISLTTIAIVVAVAWLAGRNNPLPEWISLYLVPALGWLFIGLVVIALVSRLRRK